MGMTRRASHGSLRDLTTADDHSQYAHISTARTISATHIFTGSPAFRSATSSANALTASVTGDTVSRYSPLVDGQLEWGTGSAARDTSLGRYSTAQIVLKDPRGTVAGDVRLGFLASGQPYLSLRYATTDTNAAVALLADATSQRLELGPGGSTARDIVAARVVDAVATWALTSGYFAPSRPLALAVTNHTITATLAVGTLSPFNTVNGAITITLPAASAVPVGTQITFKKLDSGTTTTIARAGSDQIDGSTTYTMTSLYASVTLTRGSGSVWWVS